VPAVAESAYPSVVANDDLLAPREAVKSAINDASQLVLDVRAESEYAEELFWPSGATEDIGRTGHVPGAASVPIGLLRAEDGTLRSADELRGVFEQAGVTKDKALITYCTIGNRALPLPSQIGAAPDVRGMFLLVVPSGDEITRGGDDARTRGSRRGVVLTAEIASSEQGEVVRHEESRDAAASVALGRDNSRERAARQGLVEIAAPGVSRMRLCRA